MAGGATKIFLFDPDKWTIENILEFVRGLGLKVSKSRRMAYHANKVPEDWPIRGYMIEGYDISFEPPEEHPQFGLVGRVDCRRVEGVIASPEERKKLYNKLKRKFGMVRADLDKKDKLFGDAAE